MGGPGRPGFAGVVCRVAELRQFCRRAAFWPKCGRTRVSSPRGRPAARADPPATSPPRWAIPGGQDWRGSSPALPSYSDFAAEPRDAKMRLDARFGVASPHGRPARPAPLRPVRGRPEPILRTGVAARRLLPRRRLLHTDRVTPHRRATAAVTRVTKNTHKAAAAAAADDSKKGHWNVGAQVPVQAVALISKCGLCPCLGCRGAQHWQARGSHAALPHASDAGSLADLSAWPAA